jgi:photosystem II stability/assembly factor-like uncharacterized protein
MKKRSFVLFLIVVLLHSCSLFSHPSSQSSAPSGDSILAFQLDPWGNDTILVSSLHGIYSSKDDTHSWEYLSQQPNTNHPIEKLYPHPSKENVWYGSNEKQLYVSSDGGDTWSSYQKGLYDKDDTFFHRVQDSFYSLFPKFQVQNLIVLDLVIPKTGSNQLFCNTSNGLYHREPSGSWSIVPSTDQKQKITHILDIPDHEILLCVSNKNEFVGISYEDYGTTLFEPFPYGDVKDIYYAPEKAIIIHSDTGIYQATISKSNVFRITMNPLYVDSNIDMVVASTSALWMTKGNQLYYSNDNAREWETIEMPISDRILSIQFESDQKKVFILTNTKGLLYSSDLQKWSSRSYSIHECHVTDIVQDAVFPTTIYCSTLHHGVYSSLDHGLTWTTMNKNIEYQSVYQLLSVEKPFHALYACTGTRGLTVSYHPDHQWSIQHSVFRGLTITAISPSTTDGQPMIVGAWDPSTEQALLYYSFNNGLAWFPKIFPSKINAIQGFSSDPSFFWIGTNHGLYFWDADTMNYEPTTFTNSISLIQPDRLHENHLFIGTWQGLYETKDRGETFQDCSCNDLYNLGRIDDFVIHSLEKHTLLVVSGGRLYQSLNEGEDWELIPSPVEYFITAIYNDSIERNIYYAGTRNHGIIYTTRNDIQWKNASSFVKP